RTTGPCLRRHSARRRPLLSGPRRWRALPTCTGGDAGIRQLSTPGNRTRGARGTDSVAQPEAAKIGHTVGHGDAAPGELRAIAEFPRAAIHLRATGAIAQRAHRGCRLVDDEGVAAEANVLEEHET